MDRFFELTKRRTNVKTEIVAGVTTFAAMSYVLMINPGMFGTLGQVSFGAVYIGTALAAVAGTLLMGLLANLPLAQASGMGLGAFFVYTVCGSMGFTYANALVFVLVDGLLFIILTLTGLRRLLFESIPFSVKAAIPVGIGLFIAFLGLQSSGLILPSETTGVTLASFNLLGNATWGTVMPLCITVAVLLSMGLLSYRQVKGAILWSILGGSLLYYLLGMTVPDFFDALTEARFLNPLDAFSSFFQESFLLVFREGFDFSAYLSIPGNSTGGLVLAFATTTLAFLMMDMFDTTGTLYSTCRGAGLTVKNDRGEETVPRMNRALMANACSICVGSFCGTSTIATCLESTAGIAVGGRSGLSSVVTAALFFVSAFLSPLAALIPAAAYAPALIFVGILMMENVTRIDWGDLYDAVPAFLTVIMMPFTYNISYGIAFGLFAYIALSVLTGKIKEIRTGTWVATLLMAAMLFLTH